MFTNASAKTLDIYVNGVLDDGVLKGTVPSAQFDPNTSVTIGRRSGGFYFNGTIDDVRVYTSALSQTQILSDMNSPVGGSPAPDTSAPTAPSGLAAGAVSASQINLNWSASSDNVGVTGYWVERSQNGGSTAFTQVASVTGTSYADTGLSAGTIYNYRVRATDAAGNLSGYSGVASTTTSNTPPHWVVLAAAYGFNEGSGTTVTDASGNGDTGTINGATWTTGGQMAWERAFL